MRHIEFKTIGTLALYGLPVLAVIGAIAPLVLGLYNLTLLGTYLVVPMIVSPLLYWKYCRDL